MVIYNSKLYIRSEEFTNDKDEFNDENDNCVLSFSFIFLEEWNNFSTFMYSICANFCDKSNIHNCIEGLKVFVE